MDSNVSAAPVMYGESNSRLQRSESAYGNWKQTLRHSRNAASVTSSDTRCIPNMVPSDHGTLPSGGSGVQHVHSGVTGVRGGKYGVSVMTH